MDEHQQWSLQENSVFEKALALHDPNSSDFFQRIATKIPDKTVQQINDHFQLLVEDIKFIEGNCFFSPNCIKPTKKSQASSSNGNNSVHQTTKKGARWTKEEHEKFLMGLRRYGKGDWRNISRNCVLTKTPTQVASHAQKYFIRLSKSSSTSQDPSNLNPNNINNILAPNTKI